MACTRCRTSCHHGATRSACWAHRAHLTWVVTVAAVLLLVVPEHGHGGDVTALAHEILSEETIDLHDGSIEDWGVGAIPPAYTKADFDPLNTGHDFPLDPQDVELSCYIGWAAETSRVYFAVEVLDDVFLGDPSGVSERAFVYDSIEIKVNGDRSDGRYCDFLGRTTEPLSPAEDSLLTNLHAQRYSVVPLLSGQVNLFPMGHAHWAAREPFAAAGATVTYPAAGASEQRTRVFIEGFVTAWDSLVWNQPTESRRSVLTAGQTIGIRFALSDCDMTPGDCHGYYSLDGASGSHCLGEGMLDVRLVATPWSTQVLDASWAGIKGAQGTVTRGDAARCRRP